MRIILYIFLFFSVLRISAQQSDSNTSPLSTWKYDYYQFGNRPITPDTIIDQIYDFMPFHKNNISSLGNNGSATFPLMFYIPDQNIPFLFNSWQWYNIDDRNDFYNTRKPFSNIKFVSGSSKDKGEQYIRILHTQNITPKLNFSIKALSHNSTGFYLRQENRTNCFRFSSNYQGEKYKVYAYYNLERFKLFENGGIVHDDYIIDSLYKPDNLGIHLGFAKNLIAFRNGYIKQELSLIGKKEIIDSLNTNYKSILELHHGSRYQWIKKIYDDKANTSFYVNNLLIDTLQTHDSLQSDHFNHFLNIVLTENNPLKTGILLGGIFDQQSFYHHYKTSNNNSYGINASVFRKTDSTSVISIEFENYLSGYLKGNSKFSGFFTYRIFKPKDIFTLSLNALFMTKNPDFFQNSWSSNNFLWDHNFSTSEYSSASINLFEKRYSFGLNAGINTVKNYIYFDTIGYPAQQNNTIKILHFEFLKNIRWGHFHFNNKFRVQQSSNDSILRIPSYIGTHSVFYQFLAFKKVLKVQIGAELYLFTKFYAPKYFPSTGQFALQNERQTGNYPFTDVFVNLNLKRACIFIKLVHANYLLSDANYFLAPHYPIAPRSLNFGVSWNFYD